MPATVLAAYLEDIHRIRRTRAGTDEISYYPALAGALNTIGATLKPRVFKRRVFAISWQQASG